ncbi:SPOR domain-containing protein [Sediminibacterium sp.]|uniref:SPOR domain-containing protein n=1 Tax=Sediminibacterium sp. TaxID=1917865 RepID=UPI003F6F12B3
MKIGCFILFFLLVNQFGVYACVRDTIIIEKDPRLDILVSKQGQINKRTAMMTSTGLYKGFRLQVISTPKRDDANQVKTDLMNRFPDQKSYTFFQSPNFKVRIGNFLKKEEAEKYRNQISKFFPKGIYIVEDTIEYTPPEEEQN